MKRIITMFVLSLIMLGVVGGLYIPAAFATNSDADLLNSATSTLGNTNFFVSILGSVMKWIGYASILFGIIIFITSFVSSNADYGRSITAVILGLLFIAIGGIIGDLASGTSGGVIASIALALHNQIWLITASFFVGGILARARGDIAALLKNPGEDGLWALIFGVIAAVVVYLAILGFWKWAGEPGGSSSSMLHMYQTAMYLKALVYTVI